MEIIYNIIVKIIYFYSLILGIISGIYNWQDQTFHITKVYLIYSALIQILLTVIPLILVFILEENDYMANKPILQWTYNVTKVAIVSTVVASTFKIWQKRQDFINLCAKYNQFLLKYRVYCQEFNFYIDKDLRKREILVKKYLIYKFFSLHLHGFIIANMYVQLQDNPDICYNIMVIFNTLQGLYLLTANLQFMLILCQISLHFSFINYSMKFLSYYKLSLKDLLKHYMILYEMHMECLKLSRLCFKACEMVSFFMLLRIFATNIILLYYMVLVVMSNLNSNGFGNFMGSLSIVNFYWDSLLVISAIDHALTSCNCCGDILRETWIVLEIRGDDETSKELMKLVSVKILANNLNIKYFYNKFN